LDEGAASRPVPIACPSCRDLVTLDGELEEVSPGDPISAFCSGCERTIEVAAPIGIDAVEERTDAVAPALTEFASGAPSA
jgi:hypothetical protein